MHVITLTSSLQAIVEGEPPGLPESGYSDVAKDFVRGCLNKIPKLRPTYAMLLNHAWLKPLTKPQTITEEAEEGEEAEEVADAVGKLDLNSGTHDQEVAEWVKDVLRRKRESKEGDGSTRPALHAAPLDSVSPLASPLAGA
jgi:mitogen-activated protein kinase kinase